jgi:SAM-dependent methyltransferase
MREWASDIVSQVLSLKPESVLEIGCGTGMLLFQIAEQCESYLGVDISRSSLDYVAKQITASSPRFDHVQLQRKAADDLSDLQSESFDVIILSSVVQYFPSIDYLCKVIEDSARLLKRSGAIVLADIRHFGLLDVFHTSVQLANAKPGDAVEEVERRAREGAHNETELAVDPRFFLALRKRIPQITSVQLRLQRGLEHNELNRFRYSAVVHFGRKIIQNDGEVTIEAGPWVCLESPKPSRPVP